MRFTVTRVSLEEIKISPHIVSAAKQYTVYSQ